MTSSFKTDPLNVHEGPVAPRVCTSGSRLGRHRHRIPCETGALEAEARERAKPSPRSRAPRPDGDGAAPLRTSGPLLETAGALSLKPTLCGQFAFLRKLTIATPARRRHKALGVVAQRGERGDQGGSQGGPWASRSVVQIHPPPPVDYPVVGGPPDREDGYGPRRRQRHHLRRCEGPVPPPGLLAFRRPV